MRKILVVVGLECLFRVSWGLLTFDIYWLSKLIDQPVVDPKLKFFENKVVFDNELELFQDFWVAFNEVIGCFF